jgi:glycosyltransferase involved in cell wall biosynthesis
VGRQLHNGEDAIMNDMSSRGMVPVTVIIAVRNEAANIAACLESLRPARRICVVDSGSTDATVTIAARLGAEVFQYRYGPGLPKKRQWALDTIDLDTDWVLLIDADERVPAMLWQEIAQAVTAEGPERGFFICKGFHFLGRRFRFGGFSFDAVLLINRHACRFEKLAFDADDQLDMEVHERMIVEGGIGRLTTPLIHDDFKGLESYLTKHNHYSTWEARLRDRFLKTGNWGDEGVEASLFGNAQERRRFLKYVAVRTPGEPLWWFFYHYVVCGAALEGWCGFHASRTRGSECGPKSPS